MINKLNISHFYLALYWAEALANQDKNAELKASFSAISEELKANETTIVNELNSAQGSAVNIEAYYAPTESLVATAMRPSTTFNTILNSIN